jgi:uncharacterized membrane protein YphA (DoxX/SURF4 family)
MIRSPKGPVARRLRLVLLPAVGATVGLSSHAAQAHERFVLHRLKVPLQNDFFTRSLFQNPDMTRIGVNVALVLLAFLVIWMFRFLLQELVEERILGSFGGTTQRVGHSAACFLTDSPVRQKLFHLAGEWAVIMLLRSPGLVLMYSATTDSLVMPSFPLDPGSATIFKFAQAGVAILILTQTLLPLAGAILLGTWLYLFRWGWYVAMDALPLLIVAAIYISSPWQSYKFTIVQLNAQQMKWVRCLLGLSFFALGWLKIWNHDLIAGVADNYPSVMHDPMVNFFAIGTDPQYRRECWVVSFGMAEVLSGFLLMIGVFTRLWSLLMLIVMTKLMLIDFGWAEIPHIYLIGALLVVIFSNKLTNELSRFEAGQAEAQRRGETLKRLALMILPPVVLAILVVFPMLELLTHSDRSGL